MRVELVEHERADAKNLGLHTFFISTWNRRVEKNSSASMGADRIDLSKSTESATVYIKHTSSLFNLNKK